MTRFFLVASVCLAVVLATSTGVAAKGQHRKAQSHSMTGCLQKGDEANTFKLTSIAGKGPRTVEIVQTATGVDLASHVGHKVTITGMPMSQQAAAKAEGTTYKKDKEERGEHHMRADAVTMVSTTCP
jgi:hypothetical protein